MCIVCSLSCAVTVFFSLATAARNPFCCCATAACNCSIFLCYAALIEKWLGCSPNARTSLSSRWSKSGCQLHRLDRCSELGLCRQSNRCRNHHSALLRLACHLDKHRCRIAILPISSAELRRPAVGLAGVGRMLEFFACIFS